MKGVGTSSMCCLCSLHMIPWEPQLRWLSQAAAFFWLEMHRRAGAARKQEGRQEARKLVRKFPLNWLVLAGFCCFGILDGKFLSISVEEQCHLWTKNTLSARLDSSPPFPCYLSGSAGPEWAADQAHCFGGAGQYLLHFWYLHWDPGSLPQETSVVKKQLWNPEVFSSS